MTDHPTVPVAHPRQDGETVPIDADLAEIIRLCWALDIETSSCCQEGDDGRAEIGFLSLDDVERFYDSVVEPDDEWDRLFDERGWLWSLWADGGLRGEVHLPRRDLSWLETRLRQAVAEGTTS